MERKEFYKLVIICTVILFNTVVMSSQSNTDSVVTIASITITDKPASSYEGIYRNGKPYDGYFEVGSRDVTQIDFYKKGKRKYQYSLDFLKRMQEPGYNSTPQFDIKSTYKNGKIFDGVAYTTVKDGIIAKKLKKGKLHSFSLDVFAMHYFNRIIFDKKADTLWVHNLKDEKSNVKSYFKNGFQIIETYMNDTLIAYNETVDYSKDHFPENCQIVSFKKNDIIQSRAHKTTSTKSRPFEKNMNVQLVSFMDVSNIKNIDTFFEQTAIALTSKEGPAALFNDKGNRSILGYFNTDESGKIDNGIRWIATKGDDGYFEIYKHGQPNEKAAMTLQKFQEEAQLYFKNSRKSNE